MAKINDFGKLANFAEAAVFADNFEKNARKEIKKQLKHDAMADGLSSEEADLVAEFFMIRDF